MNGSEGNGDDIPLAIERRMKWLVNNQRFADVLFVVGADKELIHAHKNIIASGSLVFERMFFSNHSLQMIGPGPIGIPDLTATGFINMLKYIYTNELEEVELSELFETFMAGDKYQVYNMSDTLFSFIKNVLNTSNCCIIYDQLMKFPTEYLAVPLDQVRTMIRYNSASAFKDTHFVNISQETLVDLLRMDALSIQEIVVLKSCANWVAAEIKRLNLEANATNKQIVFKPIKNFIRFSKITFDELANFKQIKDLLSSQELSSLFLHLLNVSEFTVECNTARKQLVVRRASCNKATKNSGITTFNMQHYTASVSEFSPILKTSGTIFLTKVYTFLPTSVYDLEFSIMVNGLKTEQKFEKLKRDDCWYFRFTESVKIDPTSPCQFVFKFRLTAISVYHLSPDSKMIVDDGSLVCDLSSLSNGFHCLKEINFYVIS